MRILVRVGAPSLVLTSGIALTFRLDRLILGAVGGPVAVSVYSLAGSFSEMPRFVPASFGQVAYAQAARESGRTPVRPHVLRAYAWMVPAGIVTCAVGVWFIHRLDPVYLQAIVPLLLLVVAEFLLVPFNVVMRMILGGGRVGASAVVGGVAVVFSSVVYWVCVHFWGMYGAAIASIVVYGGVSLACLLLYRSTTRKESSREHQVDTPKRHDPAADRR
jgi:O-antigen/teichoic acid export membrane protein